VFGCSSLLIQFNDHKKTLKGFLDCFLELSSDDISWQPAKGEQG